MAQSSIEQSAPHQSPVTTVLVVDDEVLIRMTVADHLRDCGFRVVEAANADEALRVLESDEPVEIVFSDIQMPGSMDGFGLAHWVRRHRPYLRVLLTSGIVRSAEISDDLCGEAPRPILSKPYDFDQLADRLRRLLED